MYASRLDDSTKRVEFSASSILLVLLRFIHTHISHSLSLSLVISSSPCLFVFFLHERVLSRSVSLVACVVTRVRIEASRRTLSVEERNERTDARWVNPLRSPFSSLSSSLCCLLFTYFLTVLSVPPTIERRSTYRRTAWPKSHTRSLRTRSTVTLLVFIWLLIVLPSFFCGDARFIPPVSVCPAFIPHAYGISLMMTTATTTNFRERS